MPGFWVIQRVWVPTLRREGAAAVMEPWLKAGAAFHQCGMRFLQLGCFVRSGRVLEIPAERESRKCSSGRKLFILLQRNRRALVGNLALSAWISYVWGFPEITGSFSEGMTDSSKWIYWISENEIKRWGQDSGQTAFWELVIFCDAVRCLWQAHDLQVESQIRINSFPPSLFIYHVCKSSVKRQGLFLHPLKNMKIVAANKSWRVQSL